MLLILGVSKVDEIDHEKGNARWKQTAASRVSFAWTILISACWHERFVEMKEEVIQDGFVHIERS